MARFHKINNKDVPFTQEEEIARDREEAAWVTRAEQNKAEEYKEQRKKEYPPVGDQLDAIWMELNLRRLNGDTLHQQADDILGQILAVKNKYPKDKK